MGSFYQRVLAGAAPWPLQSKLRSGFIFGRSLRRGQAYDAVTFGTAHFSLDPTHLRGGLGLRVVLNSVARSSLRSLDIATLDATTFLKRIQASRNADLEGFGIDVDRDLLRGSRPGRRGTLPLRGR